MTDEPTKSMRQRGLEKMAEVYGWEFEDGPGDFFGYTADHLFADIWSRPGLDTKERRLLLVGMLAAQGAADVLEIQLGAAHPVAQRERHAPQHDRLAVHVGPALEHADAAAQALHPGLDDDRIARPHRSSIPHPLDPARTGPTAHDPRAPPPAAQCFQFIDTSAAGGVDRDPGACDHRPWRVRGGAGTAR